MMNCVFFIEHTVSIQNDAKSNYNNYYKNEDDKIIQKNNIKDTINGYVYVEKK